MVDVSVFDRMRDGRVDGRGWSYEPFPILTTNVPSIGGASIHSPERFWTWRPLCGDACRSCTVTIIILSPKKKDINVATHESQEPGIIMRTYALRLALSLADNGISHDLAAMLHVLVRVVELLQSVWRQAKSFRKEGAEVVGELLDLSKICLKSLPKARDKFLIWPL